MDGTTAMTVSMGTAKLTPEDWPVPVTDKERRVFTVSFENTQVGAQIYGH